MPVPCMPVQGLPGPLANWSAYGGSFVITQPLLSWHSSVPNPSTTTHCCWPLHTLWVFAQSVIFWHWSKPTPLTSTHCFWVLHWLYVPKTQLLSSIHVVLHIPN